jgi:hypothetical protein
MKNIFKTSLLAAGVVAAMNANAMTLTAIGGGAYKPLSLSAEGVAAELVGEKATVKVAVNVSKDHPAGSVFSFSFDANAEFDGTAATTFKGTGSFGLTTVVKDNDATKKLTDTVTIEVTAGQPMLSGSQFEVTLTNVDLAGLSTLSVSSVDAAGVALETASVDLVKIQPQFSVEATTEFDNLIERINSHLFTTGADTDTATLTIGDDAAKAINGAAGAELTGNTATITLSGDFTDIADNEIWIELGANAAYDAGTDIGGVVNADEDEIVFAGVNLTANSKNALKLMSDLTMAAGTESIPETVFDVDVEIESANDSDADPEFTASASLGEWMLDASVVNVPYLPVGYGLSANVEIANEGSGDSEVQIRGFDNAGNVYTAVMLDKMAKGQAVTKISEADIMEAFGIEGKAKLSVTFIMDADAGNISLAPYYKEGESRINVISDQYKGK